MKNEFPILVVLLIATAVVAWITNWGVAITILGLIAFIGIVLDTIRLKYDN